MNKKIVCLVTLLLLTLGANVAFAAGYTEVQGYQFDLKEISLYNADANQWVTVFSGSQSVTLGSKGASQDLATLNLSQGLLPGQYTKARFTTGNTYRAKGIVNDGTNTYYSLSTTGTNPQFSKAVSTAAWAQATYTAADLNGNVEAGFHVSYTDVSGGLQCEVDLAGEGMGFMISDNTGKRIGFAFDVDYVWYGGSLHNIDIDTGSEPFVRVNADTLSAPFYDPPELTIR